MEKKHSLRKRNKMLVHFFAITILVHLVFLHLIPFHLKPFQAITSIVSVAALYALSRYVKKSIILQTIILLFFNGHVVWINLLEPSVIHILSFVFPIFITALYHSFKAMLAMLIFTIIEMIPIFSYVTLESDRMIYTHDFLFLIILLLLIAGSALWDGILVETAWQKIEERNSTYQKALYSKEGYLQLFFDNAKDGIAVFDTENKVIEMNPAFEELYGWKRDESIGKSIPLVPPENIQDAQDRFNQLLEGESYNFFETTDMRKDGTLFDAQLTLSPIYDKNERLVATSVISRDISYKKDAEKLLVESEKLKLAGEIAAGVAHEIRNPMTVISGFVQMMQADEKSPYAEYLHLIQTEIDRIQLIISEFLVLAKPHIQEMKEFVVEDMLREVTALFSPEFHLRGIVFEEKYESKESSLVGERNQMKQLFINLIKNSLEAMPEQSEGKIKIQTKLSDTHSISISIQDNGIGMSNEVKNNMFKPFFTTKLTGTGLGMMISEKIIKDHNGSVSIESFLNKGTTVTVTFPLN